jgi:hypothetical protein
MRYAPVAMALMALCIGSTAFAGANPQFTMPLHGIHPTTLTETCATAGDVDCINVLPTVELPPNPGFGAVYLMVNNHTELKGIQTAIDFGPHILILGNWTCQTNQLSLSVPAMPGGPDAGLLSTAWDCVQSTDLQIAGFMQFNMVGTGCVSHVLPTGRLFEALDCGLLLDQHDGTGADAARLGKVCQGPGGFDACEAVSPVESATWGSIKAQYK